MTDQSVQQALQAYFTHNGFGPNGGYDQKWVYLKFGALSVPLYNSRARKRAVPLHDLHHIVTGYPTTPQGEAQIAGWEIAAGVYDKWFAFVINVPALLYGLVLWPALMMVAWRAGRNSRSLYRYDFDSWMLDMTVDDLKRLTVLD